MTGPAARFAPHAVMLVLIVIWAASYATSKMALASLDPFALVAVRFWLALLCVAPFLGRTAIADLRTAAGPGLVTGVALGTGYLLQMAGLNETSSATSGLIAGLIVPLVAVGGFLFFHARLGARSLAGLALAIAGIAAICWPSGAATAADGQNDSLPGILLQLGSSTSYAGHILLLSRFGRSAPIAAFACWQMLVVAVAATVLTGMAGRVAAPPATTVAWTGELLFLVGYLGVLASAVGIGVQSKVQHRVPPTHLALLFALQPLFAAILGWLLLGDRLGALQLAGGSLIVLGVVVTSLDRTGSGG